MEKFDLVVIGGGPGGYVSAIRASQLGMKVAVIEKERMGGVCLNWGCIPTKALLQSAHLWSEVKKASQFGLDISANIVNMPKVIEHSRKVADKMASGVDFLMKKNKVTVLHGFAKFLDKHKLEILSENSEVNTQTVQSSYFIIATGARPRPLPFLPFDGEKVLSSKHAMLQESIPNRLAIIGAGAIGVEYADIYSSLGSQVTIIEALPHLLPQEDKDISKILERSFQKRKLDFYTSSKVLSAKVDKDVELNIESKENKKIQIHVDKVIVGIGILPNTEDMNLEEKGVLLEKGFVKVEKINYVTTVNNIYAIGDCINTPWLAHVASSEGIRAVEDISIKMGNPHQIQPDFINYNTIPGCTYCNPEVASVGYTEEEAIKAGYNIEIGKIPLTANGKAQAKLESDGLVKLIRDKSNSAILGAHIIGPHATELINEYVLAMNSELTTIDVGRTMHAHPTVSEGLMEAAEASMGHAIHI